MHELRIILTVFPGITIKVASLDTKLAYISCITCLSRYSSLEKKQPRCLTSSLPRAVYFYTRGKRERRYTTNQCVPPLFGFFFFCMSCYYNTTMMSQCDHFHSQLSDLVLAHPVCVRKTGKSYSRILLNRTLHQHNWFTPPPPLAFKINFNRLVHRTARILDKNRLMCSEWRPEEEELNKKIKWREKYSGT